MWHQVRSNYLGCMKFLYIQYLFLLTYLLFWHHVWHAGTVWPGIKSSTLLLTTPGLYLKTYATRGIVSGGLYYCLIYLSYTVGMYICISGLLYQLSSFFSISIFIYKFIWMPPATLEWPGLDLPNQLLLQPEQWQSETLKQGSPEGTPWELS